MIKFLIYLFIFYIISRLVFGRVTGTGTGFGTRIYRFDTHHHHYHKTEEKKEEGRITVNPKINKGSKDGNSSDNMGEYVDYEEVK
jgi:hypothetical protein